MTRETRDILIFWNNILVTVLTIALLYFAYSAARQQPTYLPQASPPSHTQAAQQHAPLQEAGQAWREWLRVLSPYIVVLMLLFVAWLNLIAARQLRKARATDAGAGKTPIQADAESREPGHSTPSLKAQQELDGGITVGTRVRLRRPSNEAERQRAPQWIPEMDHYAGREFTVSASEPNGFLQLEGLRYYAHVSWVDPIS